MSDTGAAFRALHQKGNPFVLVNVWDQGGAKLMAAAGAQALATSSAAHAFTLGRPDMGQVTRDEALAHAAQIVAATPLPVSGDFENGFGDTPEIVAETVRLSAEIGLAGISIEDTRMDVPGAYDFDLAVERIAAAAAAARALPGDFVLVARADGVMNGHYDQAEALRRIRAFDQAGADCLYVPMPPGPDDLAQICAATEKPVNALAAGPIYSALTRQDYADMGVARISLGGALARATHRTLFDLGTRILANGDFSGLTGILPAATTDAILTGGHS